MPVADIKTQNKQFSIVTNQDVSVTNTKTEPVYPTNCGLTTEPAKLYQFSQQSSQQPKLSTGNQAKSKPYQYTFQKSRTDKRVSLNVSPLGYRGSSFAKRVEYVLGSQKKVLKKGQSVWGFLYSCLSKSSGLIFPYTPQIQVNHTVNYDKTEITHSNLAINHYKNTPPPTYTVEATFTADTRENALHMLSALWFLRAVTKCDFGEQANIDEACTAGMPPPILYLNGYNQIMNNIPIIVKSFSYNLPKDKDYVSLGINLDSSTMAFNDRKLYSGADGQFIDNYDGKAKELQGNMYLNGISMAIENLQSEATTMVSNRFNAWYFNNWLPTELVFNIQLEVQPNLLKYKKQFNLDNYKMGVYNMDEFKGGVSSVYIPTSNGVQDVSNCDIPSALKHTIDYEVTTTTRNKKETSGWDKTWGAVQVAGGFVEGMFSFGGKAAQNTITNGLNNMSGTYYETVKESKQKVIELNSEEVKKVYQGMPTGALTPKSYSFDKSGFTW